MATELRMNCETGEVTEVTYALAPTPVPQSITPRQAKLALLAAGLLDAVEGFINNADRATEITWQYALSFDRDNPLINALGTQLGLSSEQIDDLFRAAAAL